MSFQKKFARKRTPKPIARRANKRAAAAQQEQEKLAAAKKPFVIGVRKEVVPTELSRKSQHVKKPFFVKFR